MVVKAELLAEILNQVSVEMVNALLNDEVEDKEYFKMIFYQQGRSFSSIVTVYKFDLP